MKKLMTILLTLAMTVGASAQQRTENSDVYDLQGRKVEKDHKLSKGVYIVNGHKKVK